ncbi:CHRD domain-containing protein [Ammoniphilus sp. CFH 90114]|uniref:CHRD domain-containing protein n=1 Tax=Ammoniphilus sp. CFH 90114 TaxID=2493665 RepID=UPI00100F6DEF|nr:CHRD domain-containing protein [Ammoniphilus sp. CFH 90114]RXT08164.1 CHRD domain-containing protein [Ammoniphilus sp. CFH 90114]
MRNFFARLRGSEEVPPVVTRATGRARFRLSRDRRRLHYVLEVENIRRTTEAHIHLGRRRENGPVVAFLFGPLRRGVTVRRGVVRGTITAADLVGPLAGRSLAALIREMRLGNTYVNVHTVQNPAGEIRGQIVRLRDDDNRRRRRRRRRRGGGDSDCG